MATACVLAAGSRHRVHFTGGRANISFASGRRLDREVAGPAR